MKIFKTVILVMFLSIILLFINTCKRASVDDPDMVDTLNTIGRLNFSGTANPSILYVPESRPEVVTVITVRAIDSDGSPLTNIKIVFQKGDYGYFEGKQASAVSYTNGSGEASINYYIPASSTAFSNSMGDTYIEIKATIADDSVIDGQATDITEYIKLRIIPYDSKDRVKIAGDITTCCPETGLACVIIELSNNGALADGVTLSRNSGSYDLTVPKGWFGTITPTLDGYSFHPSEITIENPLYKDLNKMNFYAETECQMLVDFDSYTVGVGGESNVSVGIYCNTPQCTVGYRVSSGASWITINTGQTGITRGTFTFTVDANTNNDSRTGTIRIISTDGKSTGLDITITQDGVDS